ncbi:MAG: hypothetical protein QXJ75_01730 [Candidatus Bathyarchaeia archaeon]
MSEGRGMFIVGILASIIFVVTGCVWLSVSAETLDVVAEYFGAEDVALWTPPIPDYEIPGFEGVVTVNILLGIASTILVLAVTLGVGRVLRVKK